MGTDTEYDWQVILVESEHMEEEWVCESEGLYMNCDV